jgi:ABC-type multidrug transport system ATPase subunit
MLHGPKVLLLDEPTRSLDPLAATEFRKFLKTEVVKKHGTTVLFASHTLAEVQHLADRVAVLDRGRLVAYGSPKDLRLSVGAATLEDALPRLTGTEAAIEVAS